jgi:hypothetical protein
MSVGCGNDRFTSVFSCFSSVWSASVLLPWPRRLPGQKGCHITHHYIQGTLWEGWGLHQTQTCVQVMCLDCLQFAKVKTQVNSSCFNAWCERVTSIVTVLTVLCLRQLVTNLSPRRSELDPRPGHVWSIVESGTMTGLFPCTWFPPVSVVAPVLHNHLYLNSGLIRMLSRQSVGNFELCNAFCDITERWTVK